MKNINLDSIISIAILAALMILIFRGCDGCQETAPPQQMTPEQIQEILHDNFDSLRNEQVQVIFSEIKELSELYSKPEGLTENEKLLLGRITALSTALKRQGEELKGYIELNTKTEIIKTETVYVKDSTGNIQPVPDYIKRLPLVIESNYQDSLTLINLSYDVQKDSITSQFLTYNRFKLSQSINKDGKHIATIANDNPHTYTLPGTSVFELQLPEEVKHNRLTVGLQVGGYYLVKDGAYGPGVGIGLSYDISTPVVNGFKKLFLKR